MAKANYLIGAHGMFWERDQVDWDAGRGQTYQLLGYRGGNSRTHEVCDFRRARGLYILYNDFRVTYVGRARGNEGLGSRLKMHDADGKKDWSRFCWFAFDTVAPIPADPFWREVLRDEGARDVSGDSAIDELEALMITAFGLHTTQNVMKLAAAREPWHQITVDDCWDGGVARRFDTDRRIRMARLRQALDWE